MDNKQPKRRRNKDNPYHISRKDNKFHLIFKDGLGIGHNLEIDEPLYDAFNGYELEDLSFLNEWDRHREHSELTEATLNLRAVYEPLSIEDTVINCMQNEQLHNAINELPAVQRRRLILYFFVGMTYEQIAEIEGCTKMPIKRSIDRAISELKDILC